MHAVDGVSLRGRAGRTLGIVGESGSGKTVSSLTVMGLTRAPQHARSPARSSSTARELARPPTTSCARVRGNDIAMIFQDPLSSLHPFYRIGDQLVEAVRAHRDVSKARRSTARVEMLELVGIPDAAAARRTATRTSSRAACASA